jgi:hypothetical protein
MVWSPGLRQGLSSRCVMDFGVGLDASCELERERIF